MEPMQEEFDRNFGLLATDVARLLRTAFDRRVRSLGVTRSQWTVMMRIGRYPGYNQSELAEVLEIEKATAGRHLDRLEEKGWIRREADASDRRVNRIFLNGEAQELMHTMRAIADNMISDSLAGLPRDERDQLVKMLINVKSRLGEMLQEPTPELSDDEPVEVKEVGAR
jgi:DNA-binding MarR family transcriptional regulator